VSSVPPQDGNDRALPASGLGGRPARPGPSPVPPPPSDKPTILRSPRAALEPEKVPAPKRRSKRVRHPMVIAGNAVFTVLVLTAIAVGAALYVGKQRFDAQGPLSEDKVVNIPRGLGIKDIAALLEREGVIDQPYVFIGGVTVMKARGGLKHGEYKFAKHASLADVVSTIIDGKVVQHTLTIPEGLTSEQIVARLLKDTTLSGQIKEIPREGSLLPETYKFTRGMSRAQIIRRMQQAELREVKEIWAHRMPDLPLRTPEEMVTLASIVEKETGKAEERSRVAAVFVNRLKNKMKLQSDPTIIYGLTGGKGSLGRPILKSEIEQPTPYNTYVIEGLPPGPIANPGKASLEAVAKPARTKDLFFVADGSGGHVFSETYEQHQKNVAKLRAIEHAKGPEPKPAKPDAAKNAPAAVEAGKSAAKPADKP
jgi:peptidoglycan lytic transglycosylase G